MESYAIKHVIVRIHHVIMSMDALACHVGINSNYFKIKYIFLNKQTKKTQKSINLHVPMVHTNCEGIFSMYGVNK